MFLRACTQYCSTAAGAGRGRRGRRPPRAAPSPDGQSITGPCSDTCRPAPDQYTGSRSHAQVPRGLLTAQHRLGCCSVRDNRCPSGHGRQVSAATACAGFRLAGRPCRAPQEWPATPTRSKLAYRPATKTTARDTVHCVYGAVPRPDYLMRLPENCGPGALPMPELRPYGVRGRLPGPSDLQDLHRGPVPREMSGRIKTSATHTKPGGPTVGPDRFGRRDVVSPTACASSISTRSATTCFRAFPKPGPQADFDDADGYVLTL